MTGRNPLCIAIDTPDLARALTLVRALKDHVGHAKIGLEFFLAHGTEGYRAVAGEGVPIFLDLKLHDIPNTVAGALRALMGLEPRPAIVNVHAAGGIAMMRAAAEAVAGRAKVIAVTILTSLSDDDVWDAGLARDRGTRDHALNLARLALAAGLDGVVCGPDDCAAIKAAAPRDFMTVVPGIRPLDARAQDQKRIATPLEAMRNGADILVIGRPITGAADPAHAAQAIRASLHAG